MSVKYNHYLQVHVVLNGGADIWFEDYAANMGANLADGFWTQIAAVKDWAMDECRTNGMQPAEATVNWMDFAVSSAQDLECAHTLIEQLLELIRDEGPSYMKEQAYTMAVEYGYKHDRIQS
jgi:hypothetical protein